MGWDGWEGQLRDKNRRQNRMQKTTTPVGTNYNPLPATPLGSEFMRPVEYPKAGFSNSWQTPSSYETDSYNNPYAPGTGYTPLQVGADGVTPVQPTTGELDPISTMPPVTGQSINFPVSEQGNYASFDPENLQNINQENSQNPVVPEAPGMNNWEKGALGAKALGSLTNAWAAYKGIGIQEEANRNQKNMANANLNNQASTIATSVGRKASAQAAAQGKDGDAAASAAVNRMNLRTNLNGSALRW